MIKFFTVLNYCIPLVVLIFITKDSPLYIHAFLISFVAYRSFSNFIDIYPENRNKIVLVLRDMLAEYFIVSLILYGSKYANNNTIFIVLFMTLTLVTQIKSNNKVISFVINYFPFDVPIVLWAIFQIRSGNYFAASVFAAYAGWIYWFATKNSQKNVTPLYAYAIWNVGLVCVVLSVLFFYKGQII